MYLNFVNIIAKNPQGGIPGYEVVPAIQMSAGQVVINHEIGGGFKVVTTLKNEFIIGTNQVPYSMCQAVPGSGWRIATRLSWGAFYGTFRGDTWYECEFVIARNNTPSIIKVNGAVLAIGQENVNSYSTNRIVLFNRNETIASYNTAFQRTKIYDMQDNLLFDLQPVVRLSDNAVGVYDYLSDTFIEADGIMIPIYSV